MVLSLSSHQLCTKTKELCPPEIVRPGWGYPALKPLLGRWEALIRVFQEGLMDTPLFLNREIGLINLAIVLINLYNMAGEQTQESITSAF